MQAAVVFLKSAFFSLFLTAHAVWAGFVPHPIVAVPTHTESVSVSTQKTTHAFPIVKNTKPSQNIPAKKSSDLLPPVGQTSSRNNPATVTLPPALPQSQVNDIARASLVNILCLTKAGGYLYPISGSGMIISEGGVILTNAHVGQYFLLRDYVVPNNIDCVIRTGSPAHNTYRAELLYLPPAWINANASQITADTEMGTGEYDYAFLRITSPTDPSSVLPSSFPSIAMTVNEPWIDGPVMLASYPAGFLQGITIEMNLYISTAISTIKEIFAFDGRGYPDVVSVGGTVVSQAGSSGGGIVRMQDGALQAIVATATAGDDTASRDLHGITLGYIDRSLREDGQGGIAAMLTGDLKQKAADFAATTGKTETQTLFTALKKH